MLLADSDGPEADGAGYPCPACDAPLFGWATARDPRGGEGRFVVDRCERCGLAVTRAEETPDVEAELDPLLEADPDGAMRLEAANRGSLQAWLGGGGWAALEPAVRRLHLNRDSARLLLTRCGLEVEAVSTPYRSAARRQMMVTLINAFTLREGYFRDSRAGLLPDPASARERWSRRLDFAVSRIVWGPCALVAYPLEGAASIVGRGGTIAIRARRLGTAAPAADPPSGERGPARPRA